MISLRSPVLQTRSFVLRMFLLFFYQLTYSDVRQPTFSKLFHFFVCCYGLTYSERLTKLRIETLELRRLYLNLVYVYKILFGIWLRPRCLLILYCISSIPAHGAIVLNYLLTTHVLMPVNIFFCNRVVQCWNSLPATPTDFSSLTCFRSLLKRTDLSRFRIGKDCCFLKSLI